MRKPRSLAELLTELQRYYSAAHAQMERADNLYHSRFPNTIELPPGVLPHESSTAAQIVDGFRDQVRISEPKVIYHAKGVGVQHARHKTKMEQWGLAALRVAARKANANPFRQAVHDLLLRGASCIKCLVDVDEIPDPPTNPTPRALRQWRIAAANAWPYKVRAVDPLAVYPAPGPYRPPAFVLEVRWRHAYEIEAAFPAWRDKGDNPTRRVQWLEYWDDQHYIVEVEGQTIIDQPNPYGKVPYVWAYSGLGRENYDGDPSSLATGVLSSIAGELEEEARIKTVIGAMAAYHAFPRLITTLDPAVARRLFGAGPGAIIQVPTMADRPVWLDTPPPPTQVLNYLGLIRENIFRKAPAALSERPTGVESAIHQALLIGQALKIITPIKDSLNAMATDLVNLMAHQAYVMQLTLNVHGLTGDLEKPMMVSPDDFEHIAFEVEFLATDPAEDDRRILTGLSILSRPGLISRRTWREKFGRGIVEDPDQEDVLILSEQVLDQLAQSGALGGVVLEALQQQQGPTQQRSPALSELEDAFRRARTVEGAAGGGVNIPAIQEAAQEAFRSAGITRRETTQGPLAPQ